MSVGGSRERRQFNRGFQSCRAVYGIETPEHQATARRISPRGLFLSTNRAVFSPGVTIVIDLEIGGAVHRVRGIIRHSLKIDTRLVRIMRPGMGVEFLDPSPELVRAIVETT